MSEGPVTTETVTLDELVGEHELTGVDFGSFVHPEGSWSAGESSDTCVFILDGTTYTVTQDANDGYRSSMESIVKGGAEVSNRFPACRVLCRMRIKGEYNQIDDVLEMLDMVTGKLVLEVGTSNTDDYYPYYTANFDPTAMEINSGK